MSTTTRLVLVLTIEGPPVEGHDLAAVVRDALAFSTAGEALSDALAGADYEPEGIRFEVVGEVIG